MFAKLEQYRAWLYAQERRERHEWARWDGSAEHATVINDAQCDRAIEEQKRLGLTKDDMSRLYQYQTKGTAAKRPEWRAD